MNSSLLVDNTATGSKWLMHAVPSVSNNWNGLKRVHL